MSLPIVFDSPAARGREILSSLSSVKRVRLKEASGPQCSYCGSSLSDSITTRMRVNGVDRCPVCVLKDVHPNARPRSLRDVTSKNDLKSMIRSEHGSPPDRSVDNNATLPGAYILWSPPREEELPKRLEVAKRLGNMYVNVLNAGRGNGLLYVGESKNVANRVYQHLRGEGAMLTTVMDPTQLVAVDWKSPDKSLKELEDSLGRQLARAVDKKGYDMEVYWD